MVPRDGMPRNVEPSALLSMLSLSSSDTRCASNDEYWVLCSLLLKYWILLHLNVTHIIAVRDYICVVLSSADMSSRRKCVPVYI